MENVLSVVLIWVIPVLLAITLHEVAHGWAALWLGDRTAQMLGRLSLNPLRHVDPIGTVALPLGLVAISWLAGVPPFVFGWAKAVPVNMHHFTHPRRDMAFVAMAGPASNFVQAVLWGWLLHFSFGSMTEAIHAMAVAGLTINIVLIALNMLPLPPLDGSHLVSALLSPQLAALYEKLSPYGLLILLVLMVTNVLPLILQPVFNGVKWVVMFWVGIQ